MFKASYCGLMLLAIGLAGCQEMATEGMPPNQPIAGDKFAAIHTGMTFGEFEKPFGEGWMSHAMETDAKYWFFDDGRTVVVSADVWKSPQVPLKYHLIGAAPEARMAAMPILQPSTDIKLITPH